MNTSELKTNNGGEHTLVCLSTSPSNAKIIYAASKMARAYGGKFTALYVSTPASEHMDEDNKNRLESHIRLAQSLGADIATVYGDDVSYQIAEFARLSGVTEVVIGRSNTKRRYFFQEPSLTEKLIELSPWLDIHIIPDNTGEINYREKKRSFGKQMIPRAIDLLIMAFFLTFATLIGIWFSSINVSEVNSIAVYILGVLLISLTTRGYTCGVISSLLSVTLFNYFLTEPLYTFQAYDPRYGVTFASMLVTSIIIGTLTAKLKDTARQSAQTSFKTKVLFDTNKLLQKEREDTEMIKIAASQLCVLLDRNVIAYREENGVLLRGYVFLSRTDPNDSVFFSESEVKAANWALKNRKRSDTSVEVSADTQCLYLSLRVNDRVYGVVGIHIKNRPLDPFETSVILSILDECSLAIENSRNIKDKEEADLRAKNEQLRANLLRTISHDLRTPLTSISGNASNLLTDYRELDDETRTQIFTDIFDDSQWLINLVENLLSVTRIEEGRMKLNISAQLIDEVIDEALKHVDRRSTEHNITVNYKDDLMLALVDSRLIIQVIINIVDNAIKYTEPGSTISIEAEKVEDEVVVRISDDGPGIQNEDKEHVFDMFYTGNNKVADSRRSLGLGLPLCRSIVNAHGGSLTLTDNKPHGSVFSFTLPAEEAKYSEQTIDSDR